MLGGLRISLKGSVTLRAILEECRDGVDGAAFNEVVVMLESTAAAAGVWMDFDDLRFTPDDRVVTLMVPDGTHMHLDMSKIWEAEFVHTTTNRGLPSCQLWMRDGDGNPAMHICLRKSDNDATNPPRHAFFLSMLEKYTRPIALPADAFGAAGVHP